MVCPVPAFRPPRTRNDIEPQTHFWRPKRDPTPIIRLKFRPLIVHFFHKQVEATTQDWTDKRFQKFRLGGEVATWTLPNLTIPRVSFIILPWLIKIQMTKYQFGAILFSLTAGDITVFSRNPLVQEWGSRCYLEYLINAVIVTNWVNIWGSCCDEQRTPLGFVTSIFHTSKELKHFPMLFLSLSPSPPRLPNIDRALPCRFPVVIGHLVVNLPSNLFPEMPIRRLIVKKLLSYLKNLSVAFSTFLMVFHSQKCAINRKATLLVLGQVWGDLNLAATIWWT